MTAWDVRGTLLSKRQAWIGWLVKVFVSTTGSLPFRFALLAVLLT